MYKLRNRIVNFRVTPEEFERLKTASSLQGSRCLSDFARSLVLGIANPPAPAAGACGSCEERVHSMEQRLATLESSVTRLEGALLSSRQDSVESET